MNLTKHIRNLVKHAETGLAIVGADLCPEATAARTYLTRQLWWGEQVLTALREGHDYEDAAEQLAINSRAAMRAMDALEQALTKALQP